MRRPWIVSCAITTSAFALGAAVTPAAVGAAGCSSAGLRYTDERDGATFTGRVTKLRATKVSCAVARDLAGRVVRAGVEGRTVPRRYRNFTIKDTTTCKTCGPTRTWRASRPIGGGRRAVVTFTSVGGS